MRVIGCARVGSEVGAPGLDPVGGLQRPQRIALYSHDSVGLGHVRRNLLLAGRLSEDGHDVLLVCGSPEAVTMTRPPRTDIVTLPALVKDEHGSYRARHLSAALSELVELRRGILTAALSGFSPDLLIVDRHARGFLGELEPALETLTHTRAVLGLRDVLDGPVHVRREWQHFATTDALARWYDEVWVYGDPGLVPPLDAAGITSPVPTRAVGYLRGSRPAAGTSGAASDDHPFVLCTVGGGADGRQLATAAVTVGAPPGYRLVLVTGPQMPDDEHAELVARARTRDDVEVRRFVSDLPALLASASAAVIMGGYNTVCEALATSTPTLVVPRERPRLEQRIRAEILAGRELVDVVPSTVDLEAHLGAWLARAIDRPRRPRTGIDLDGLQRVSEQVRRLTSRTGPSRATAAPNRPTTTLERARHVAV